MTTIRLKRAPDSGEIVAPGDSCISCHGCGQQAVQVAFPDDVDEVELSMSVPDQMRLLWNSLGKPIVCLLLAITLSGLLQFNEMATVVTAVLGFMLGYVGCVRLPADLLEKTSVS